MTDVKLGCSQDDLRAFQVKYFSLPPGFLPHLSSTGEQLDIEEEEHYADGMKRTLTDEQIRIFASSTGEQLDIEETDEEEKESIPFSEHDSRDPGAGKDPSTITSLPEVDSQPKALSSNPAERPIAQSDTMEQKEDISGTTERASSERRRKRKKTLGHDEDQLPIGETDPRAGALAR
jgi:uncharacterized protein DUF3807